MAWVWNYWAKRGEQPGVKASAGDKTGKYWISPTGVEFPIMAHYPFIKLHSNEWSKFDKDGSLAKELGDIEKDASSGSLVEDIMFEQAFYLAGWVRVDGDSIEAIPEKLPLAKKFVKDHILKDDREKFIVVRLDDGGEFEGRAMDFMRWDGKSSGVPVAGQIIFTAEKAIKHLPGSKHWKDPDSDFDSDSLAQGQKVEMEHTTDSALAKTIAKDHLKEDPNYYKKLKKVEGGVTNAHAVGHLVFGVDLFTRVAKAATTALQEDPQFDGYQKNAELAETFGEAQQKLSDARTLEEIEKVWEEYDITPNFEILKSTVE
jgi:hypothetical protein